MLTLSVTPSASEIALPMDGPIPEALTVWSLSTVAFSSRKAFFGGIFPSPILMILSFRITFARNIDPFSLKWTDGSSGKELK